MSEPQQAFIAQQMRITYSPEEDRLLWQVSTKESEYRFWLSRRLVAGLQPMLSQLLAKQVEQAHIQNEKMAPMDAHTALNEADRKTEYQTPKAAENQPPKAAQVIRTVNFNLNTQGFVIANIADCDELLALHRSLVSGMVALLKERADQAQWGLDLKLPEQTQLGEQVVH